MKKLIIANWKMQLKYRESLTLAKSFKQKIKSSSNELVICPDYLALPALATILKKSLFRWGAQDSAASSRGAQTGEVSPFDLKSLGASYVIIGHSERREQLGESDALINAKIKSALENKLVPVLCVGEKLSESKSGGAKKYLSRQLRLSLKGVKIKSASELVIAYEPLWAIGTGQAIIPKEAGIINAFIKAQAAKIIGRSVRVLYGGSVSAANASLFLKEKNVDGLLIGGASLKAEEFKKICS